MGLNHIYKVIWSKTKNAWVVVSEIAKRDGKSSVKSVVTSLAGKSVAAVMVAMVMCGGVASAATGTQYGTGATAAYNTSVAVGENAQATNSGVTLVGANSQIQGQYSTVVGINNKDYGTSTNNNEILGSVNNVKGQHNIIVGNGTTISSQGNASSISSDAEGNYNVALGDFQSIGGDKNISILSDGYRLRGKQNISIGYGSHVGDSRNAEFALAIGAASAQGNNTVAIGHSALAENVHNSDTSIAIGTLAQASDSIAIGSNSSGPVSSTRAYLNAQGSSVNIGFRNAIANNKSVILGTNNNYGFGGGVPVSTDGGVVIGHDNYISSAKNEIIIGSENNTNGESQIAIGTNIQSNTHLGGVKGAVAIGYNSEFATLNKPSGTLNINGVNLDASNYAGNSSSLTYGNTFSIGKLNNERQLKNVAAGEISATSTDAINGSQLYEAVRAVTAGASPDVYMHVNDGTSTQGAGGGNNLGKANEKSGALGNYSIAVGRNAQSKGTNSISIGYQSGTTNDQSIAIGGNAHVNSSHSIAIGDNANASGTYSIAMGASSVNGDKNLALNNSYVYSGNDSVAINGSLVAGNNNIAIGGAYIGAGRTYSRDASGNPTSNIGNMQTAAPTLGISNMQGEQYLEPVKNSIAIGNNAYVTRSNTIVMGDKTFDNIKSSKTATDFIAPTKSKFSSIFSGSINLYHEGTLGNSVYLGHDSYAFTPDALTDGENSSSGENSIHTKKYDSTGNIVVSNNTTGGAFGKVSKATINGDEITGFAGAQSVGAVTIGAGDYERRIQNVAAGEVSATSTDGINGSQLYAVANTLSKNMSSYMHINDGTGTQTAGNATTNYGYSGSIGGALGQYSIAVGVNANSSLTSQESIAIGHNANTQAIESIAIGKDAKTIKLSSVALGALTESKGEHSVSVGYAAKAGSDSSISIGNSASSDTISTMSTVIGAGSSTSNSTKSIILGSQNTIKGTSNDSSSSINIGTGSTINDSRAAIAIGAVLNISASEGGVGIGTNATIDNSLHGVAIGSSASVKNGATGIAIGDDSGASAYGAIAIGTSAKASALQSISIGFGNEVKGAKSSAIGDPSYIDTTATGTHVQGNDNGTATNPIKASESTFMGNTNLAGTAGTTGIHVVGNNNSVDSSNVMVMGNGVTVGTGLDGAVVLGNASSADQYAAATDSTINGVTFAAAGYAGNTGLNNGSIVSVGANGAERQIKNVAAGAVTATSTDAVNGSQLYKTAETILKMPINMAGDSGDTVGLKLGKTVNIKGSVASGADVTDGNIAVVGDKATSTLSLKMAKNLTGLTSGTFTDASGNQTVINGAGVTVTPTGTGATPISITTSGINAGNQEIKGVKKGTTDDAAVNKKQMDDALAGISSTLTINDGTTDGSVNLKTGKLKVVGESGTNALVTTTVSGDTISVGTSTKLQNAVTAAEKSADKDLSNLSTTGSDKVKTLAQDAVKVAGTGLATVSDATAAGVKTYTVNVDEGKLVIDDTTGKIGANGATQGTTQGKNGVATTQDVASVVNSAIDKTKQALTDAKHDFAGDDATVISRKHGEQLNIKGGASTTASDLTSGNIAVVGDTTSGTLNIKLAKVLTGLTSATYTDGAGNTQTVTGGSSTISDAAGNSTVVSKGGVTTTDAAGNTTTTAPTGVTVTPAGAGAIPISVTTSRISAGNKEIKNVAKGTTDDAAVNKKQMDDALKGATDNTVSLGSESGSTTAKKLSTTGGIKFNIKGETGANALITTSATGDDVTVAPTAKLTAAVTAAEKSADKDLSNLSAAGDTYIKNLAKTAASWNVETNGAGTTAVAGGETVNFINGDNIAITNTGRSITIGTAKNVSFDKVTVGGIVLDKTDGINAGGKEIKGVATGTAADSAVNKAQMDAAITAAAGGSLSTEKVVAKTLTGDNNLATVAGQTGTAKGETYEVSVSENAVKAVAATAAQDAVKVAGTGLATVSDATAAGVKTYTVNVDEGKLVIDDTTGKVGAAGSTQGTTAGKDGVATTQNVASVVNAAIDKTTQALADAKHDFAGDDSTVISRKHGEQLNIKGGASTTATDLTSGNIAVVGDTTSGTLNIKLAKVLTGLTSATYTDAAGNTQTVTGGSSTISDAAGNSTVVSKGGVTTTDGTNTTTVAPAGVTATDGTNTVTLTGSGIDAGNTQIKNVGKATTDDAAVNKKQMDDALKGATDNTVSLGSESGSTTAKKLSTTGGIKFNIKGETGANALITTSATGDDVTIAPTAKLTAAVTAAEKSADKDLSNISPAGETVIKNLAATSAQDAVKVTGTGLATVSDSTTGGVKTYNVDVKTGNLVVNAAGQAGATGTTGAGGAAGADGVATTQNVASAINDAITKSKTDTAQAIADAEHKFDGDTGTTSVRKHGEVLSIKGGVTNTADLTTGNIGVVSDGAGTLNIRLAKTLTGLTSAAFTDGTHTVTIAGSGIDAGNTEIKHVGKATTDDAAVNKKQMDDAVKAATDSVTTLGDNKVSLGSDSGTTTAKKLSTTGGIKFNIKGDTGANALITTSATGDDVTIAPTAKLSAAVTAAENSANKDLSNLSTAGNTYIQNLAKSAASWNVETNGAGTTAVAGGDTVNFINGDNIAITNTGRSITIGTAKNVSFDKVTVGGVVIDKNNGIDAGGKEITNVGPATSGNSAVNKTQMDTAITNAVNKATTDAKHDFGGDDATVVTRKHGEKLNIKGGASTTAADLTSGNIAVLGDAATGTLNIRMAKALTGLSSATFTTPSGTTVINGGGMTITPSTTGAAPISITTGGINAGNTEIKNVAAGTTPNSAVNKQQMDNAISNATANVGFSTAGNTGTGSVSNGQTLTITGTNGIETNASGQSITVGLDAATRAQINNATTTANNAAKKDLSNIDNAGKQVIKDTAAWNVKVNSGAPEIVKGGDTVTFNDGDNIKVTNTGKDITIATKKDVSFDKVTVGNVVIDKNTNRISGLANAANNDEAVNLGQMNAAISTATAGTGTIKYKANGGAQNSVALTTGFDFKGDSNIQITADPANSGVINYKLNPALTGITSISGGTGAPTITLNAGSGSTPGNVSINSNLDMGGKQINNIGAATHAGDAVNKAQMDQALQNIAGASSNAAKSYAYKAGAGAAALAALKPIQYDPLEPTQIMAGIGNYKSQTAVALGVAHYTNENTMFNLGVSLDSHDGIVNAGVTHKFGYSPEKKAIPDKYKGGPISSIYVMQDEVTALQAIVQKQAAENEALRQQNEDMQRKVDMILSKIH